MFKIWCEWDICQEGLVFKTREKALKWLYENSILEEVCEPGLQGKDAVENLMSSGLLSIETVDVEGE